MAKELHQKADVPESLRGLQEIAKFQVVIEDYQIVVLSAEHFDAIIYEGPKREKQIYLYLYENHLMSSHLSHTFWEKATGFLNARKAMTQKKFHCRNRVCKCSFTEGCRGIIEKAR